MTSSTHRTVDTATSTDTFERAARAGYVARGVIYVLIGVLAVRLAWGVGGTPNQEGAMRLVARQPFGRVLLVILAAGLAGYTLLRLTQAFAGRTPEAGRQSVVDRVGAFGSGCAYGLFAALAVATLAGSGGRQKPGSTTADVFGWPAGRWLVVLAGVVFVVVGAYQARQGLTRSFLKDTKAMYMSPRGLRRFTALGVVGHVSRAVVFGLVGVFLLKAAVEYDPHEAVGIDGALRRLTESPGGSATLVIVAAGLIAFGVYSAVDARYRKI